MNDDVKAAVERFHEWEFDGLDARDHATLLAHLDGEAARTAAAVAAATVGVGPCDDCGKDAGIRVCTGCWEKSKAAATKPLADRIAELEQEVIKSNHRALELQYLLDDATKRAETAERIDRYNREGLR